MTQAELEKIKKDLVNLEEELEGYIEEYKADGKITQEERAKLKNTKNTIKYIKKEFSKAAKVFQREQKLLGKTNEKIEEATVEDYKNLTASTGNMMHSPEEELPIEPIDFTNKITDSRFLEATLNYNLKLIIKSLNPFSLDHEIIKEIEDDNSEIRLPYNGNCNITLVFYWKYTENTSGRKDVIENLKSFQEGTHKVSFQCLVEDYKIDDISFKERERINESFFNTPFYHIKEITDNVTNSELSLSFNFGRSPKKKTLTMNSIKDFSFSKGFKIKILPFPKKDVQKTAVFIRKEVLFEEENQKDISNTQFIELEKWYFSLSDDIRKQIEDRALKIRIKGYTTHSGSKKHNSDLGNYRANNVLNVLERFIGEGLADISKKSIGEREKSKRYAEIIIESK